MGCTTTNQLSSIQHNNLDTLLTKGDQAFSAWKKDYRVRDLSAAELYYGRALEHEPNHYGLRLAYYSVLFDLAIVNSTKWLSKLEANFESFDIEEKVDLDPPAFSEYLSATFQNKGAKERMALLRKGLSQGGSTGILWFNYGKIFISLDNPVAGLYNLEKAEALSENVPQIFANKIIALKGIHNWNECVYGPINNKELMMAIGKAHRKAVELAPNNTTYINDFANYYKYNGNFALARNLAEKASTIDRSLDTLIQLGDSYLGLGEIDKARLVLKEQVDKHNYFDGYNLLINTALIQGNLEEIPAHMREMKKHEWDRLYTQLTRIWTQALIDKHSQPAKKISEDTLKGQVSSLTTKTGWQTSIRDYLTSSGPGPDLVNQAKNGCEMTEAYFYTAMKHWFNGDTEASKIFLEKTLNQRSFLFIEHWKADAYLKSGLL